MEHVLTLSFLQGISRMQILQLYREVGSAERILSGDLPDNVVPKAKQQFRKALAESLPAARERAKREMEYCQRWGIEVLSLLDPAYPALLKECPDAPLTLFYQGNKPLNVPHALSIVGTRKITPMGIDLCRHLCEDLAQLLPDVMIVSGLAYGVDVEAHRGALKNGLSTIGVLAHGLGQIYPYAHREIAKEMVQQGGLITEYPHDVSPRKESFVHRNRIVAGMTSATIVVESAERGGALITAQLALDYNRSVLAFPGRPFDTYSVGCNRLIQQNTAALVTSAEDVVKALNWKLPAQGKQSVQRELFPDFTPEEQRLVEQLQTADQRSVDQLAMATQLPIAKVLALLFELELKGVVRPLVGGNYGWIR